MRFLQTHPRGPGSAYELLAIERELARHGFLPISGLATQVARVAGRLGLDTLLHPAPRDPVLLAHGGLPLTFPRALWTHFIPWSFDCWPPQWPRWESFYHRHRTQIAFLTARQCAEHFQARFPGRPFVWLPECIDPAEYNPGGPLADRPIDVLELGRNHAKFHAAIQPLLRQRNAIHLYEKIRGEIIFPTREALVNAYATTRISVCFPSSVTHPERSGSVETLTFRYLEAMASRTLIVGQCPGELRDLFGYDPVIELSDPRRITDVLGNIATHQPLVDRNYQRLLEVGTHTVRVEQLIAALRANGYLTALED